MKHQRQITVFFILFLAILLRFINYSNRWGLGYDQALFAITGKYAVDAHAIPLLGPFSSGGPFQTGGEWYWLVAIGTALLPHIIYGPWIFMGIVSVLFVVVLMATGWILGGWPLALITGLLASVSTAQITQSTNLSNQTPIALPAILSIWAGLQYAKTKKSHFLFFLGLCIGIASSIHLQGAGLLPLAAVALAFGGIPTIKGIFLLGFGLLLPWLPVLWVDTGNNWYNTKNMIYYYTVDQYLISFEVLGRRWLTFAFEFIPAIWSFTIGGYRWAGVITLCIGLCVVVYLGLRRKIVKSWLYIVLSFTGSVIIVRYTRAPLYDSFVVFLHPFILLITAGIVWFLLGLNKYVGIIFLTFLITTSLFKNYEEITHATNTSATDAIRLRSELTILFPNRAFVLYDYYYKQANKTLPLLMYLDEHDLLSPDGVRIGISYPNADIDPAHPILYHDANGIVIYDLQSSNSAQLETEHWALLTPKIVYDSTQNWYQKSKK